MHVEGHILGRAFDGEIDDAGAVVFPQSDGEIGIGAFAEAAHDVSGALADVEAAENAHAEAEDVGVEAVGAGAGAATR